MGPLGLITGIPAAALASFGHYGVRYNKKFAAHNKAVEELTGRRLKEGKA
ncbi:hypothetical protein L0Y41_01990 [bacterium]|nr:hypothetical protein [bacterium]